VKGYRLGCNELYLPEALTRDICALSQQSSCLKTGSVPLQKKRRKKKKEIEELSESLRKKEKK
jgi:hypothetical protein